MLPRNARDVFRLGPVERVLYNGLISLHRLTGTWRYPMRTCGDLAHMRLMDKVYWVHKAERPIRRAQRGSGLEDFFANHSWPGWTPPEGFVAIGDEVSVSAVGDLMDHPFLGRSEGTLYRDVEGLIFGADVSMGNLECNVMPSGEPLALNAASGASLWFSPQRFDIVTGGISGRFSCLATACNHSLDFGLEGVELTTRFIRDAGISFNGMNLTEGAASRATVIEKGSLKVAVVAWTFGLNARRPPTDRPWTINHTNLNDASDTVDLTGIARQIQSARDEGADVIVANLHWGLEHEFYPTPEQRGTAHRLAEIGIDLIVGHHPHVLQPVEYYRTRRDPYRVVPIYYSLGNLINPFSASYLCRSAIARVTLVKGVSSDGTTTAYVKRANLAAVDQIADGHAGTLRLAVAQDQSG